MFRKMVKFFDLRDFFKSNEGRMALICLPIVPAVGGFFGYVTGIVHGMAIPLMVVGAVFGLLTQLYVFREGVLNEGKVSQYNMFGIVFVWLWR